MRTLGIPEEFGGTPVEGCAVPKDHCLVENVAMSRAGVYFRPGKIIVAAKNLGVGMAAFERTADYVQTLRAQEALRRGSRSAPRSPSRIASARDMENL